MFDVIINALKRVRLKLVLKEIHIESYLNYYRLDFLDKYGNWCRLSIFYNDTHFFVDNVKLIGEGRPEIYTDSIINSIELKGTYEDFLKCKSPQFTKEELDKFFSDNLDRISQDIHSIQIPDFKIKEVRVYSMPTMMVFVYFTFKKVRFEPIRIFIGEEITYKGDLVGMDLLIKEIKEVLNYERLLGA